MRLYPAVFVTICHIQRLLTYAHQSIDYSHSVGGGAEKAVRLRYMKSPEKLSRQSRERAIGQ
jgi:hypothetical protein